MLWDIVWWDDTQYPATLGCGCSKRNLKGSLLASFFFSALFFWTKLREEGGSLFHSHNSPLSGMAEVKDWIGPAETSVPLLCWTAVPLHTSTICCFLGSNAGREGVWTTVVRGGEMGRCRSMGNEPSLTFTAHEITNFARYCASQGQNLPSLTRQN